MNRRMAMVGAGGVALFGLLLWLALRVSEPETRSQAVEPVTTVSPTKSVGLTGSTGFSVDLPPEGTGVTSSTTTNAAGPRYLPKTSLMAKMLAACRRGTAKGMWEALKETGIDLPWEEFREYFIKVKSGGMGLDTVLGGWDQLLQFWTERHPKEAIAWAEMQRLNAGPNGPDEIFYRMVNSWGQADAAAALAYAKQAGFASTLRGSQVIRELEMQKDRPPNRYEPSASGQHVQALLDVLRAPGSSVDALANAFRGVAQLDSFPSLEDKPLLSLDEYRSLAARLSGQVEEELLGAYLVRFDPMEAVRSAQGRPEVLLAVWREWGKSDPTAALNAAGSGSDRNLIYQVMEDALPGLARSSPNAAIEWVNQQTDPQVWSAAVPRLLKSMPAEDAVATVKFLLSEPVAAEMQAAIMNTVVSLGFDDPVASASAVRTVLGQIGVLPAGKVDMARWNSLDASVRAQFLGGSEDLLGHLSYFNPTAALRWANELAPLFATRANMSALQSAYSNWAKQNPDAAANWLASSAFAATQRDWITSQDAP